MDNFRLYPVDSSHNDRMLAILEHSPINANGLSLCFDKSPDIFRISELKYYDCMHLGFFSGAELKGFASVGFYDALVHGRNEKIFTFYNFYILPEARGNRLSELAMREFIAYAGERASFGLAMTPMGNHPAEFYINRKDQTWMPTARVVDNLVVKSIIFSFPRKNRSSYKVRNANLKDIPDMIRLLSYEHSKRDFGLVFETESFINNMKKRGVELSDYFVAEDRRGAVCGVCLAWDCNAFRRTRVMRVSPRFYPLLWGFRAMEKIFPMAPFPAHGESFRELTITDYAVEGRDPQIMNALLSEIYHRNRGGRFHFMNFASCATDPILKAASGFWCNNLVSHIAFTCLDPGRHNICIRLPYIDLAFL